MKISPERLAELNDNRLYKTLGINVFRAEEGLAESRMEPQAEVCWPFPGQPHGGVVFAQMDTTMAWALWSELGPGLNCTTISLNIDYSAPAGDKTLTCRAEVTQKTNKLGFIRAESRDPDGRLVATGQGIFRIIKLDIFD